MVGVGRVRGLSISVYWMLLSMAKLVDQKKILSIFEKIAKIENFPIFGPKSHFFVKKPIFCQYFFLGFSIPHQLPFLLYTFDKPFNKLPIPWGMTGNPRPHFCLSPIFHRKWGICYFWPTPQIFFTLPFFTPYFSNTITLMLTNTYVTM